MTKAPFYLTRQAARTLRDIYARSIEVWGGKTADRYIGEIYAVMNAIAEDPKLGKKRKSRSAPFSMTPAGKHFVVYDIFEKGAVILALLHQRRNIERIIETMKPEYLSEIQAIRNRLNKKSNP